MVGQPACAATDGNAGADNAGNGHANAHSDGDVNARCGGSRSDEHTVGSFIAYSLTVDR